jgi:zinc/manganese transport system ATP-binding protein
VTPAIRLCKLTVGYDRQPAIRDINGSFEAGSLTAVTGPNGAGKTTLLKVICGLLQPGSGRVELEGFGRGQIAYLPQRSEIDRSFPIAVQDVVGLGHWRRTGAFRPIGHAGADAVAQALAQVGLEGCAGWTIGAMSAGQFQRVLFARLIVQDCPVILLDEPFAAVDIRTKADLLAIVRAWHREQRTVVVVLHELAQVSADFPETLLLAHQVIDWGPTERVLHADNLLRAWGLPEAVAESAGLPRLRRSA